MLSPILFRVIGGGLFFFLAFSSGWIMHGWKYDSQYKEIYNSAIQQVKTQDLENQALAKDYYKKLRVYQDKVEELDGKVKSEVAQNSVYTDCIYPDTGVLLINSAIESANKVITSK